MLIRTLRQLTYLFANQENQTIPTLASIRKTKKADKDLQNLKKNLSVLEPLSAKNLYAEYYHTEIYKKVDTNLEAFFFKRSYTLENFNFLMNLLGYQKKVDKIPEVLKKMSLMKIEPDEKTYNYMIRAASHMGNAKLAEKYLTDAKQKFGHSKYFYTSLMQVYIWTHNDEMVEKILQEMIELGIEPDLAVYSSLINGYRIGRSLHKCNQLHQKVLSKKLELDEAYAGVMLKVYAASHDAEAAIKLYREIIIAKKIKPSLETTNSYFKALSGRAEYGSRVIDEFLNMTESGKIINEETVRWALRGCAKTANIKSAIEILKIMSLKDIQPTGYVYSSLMLTYASACLVPDLTTKQRDLILTDTWKLLEEVISKGLLDDHILNNAMMVYANALEEAKIEGLILPLYEKFNIEMTPFTFEVLMKLQYNKKDFGAAIKVWEQMKLKLDEIKRNSILLEGKHRVEANPNRENLRPTFGTMDLYLQIGIRLMDMKMVLDALEMYKKIRRPPRNSTLKFLGNLNNLPIEIQTSLMDFKIRFGAAKEAKTKTNSQKNVPDPQVS